MTFDPSMEAALTNDLFVKPFVAFEIQFANASVYLTDGLAEISFVKSDGNSATFSSFDPNYGVITAINSWQDGNVDLAPSTTVTLMVANSAIQPVVEDIRNQGKPINIYFGLVDVNSGATIGVPELLFGGIQDVATLKASGSTNTQYEIAVISVWERFFNQDQGARLNLRWQQQIHPGETGFQFVNDNLNELWWGNGTMPTPFTTIPTSTVATRLNYNPNA